MRLQLRPAVASTILVALLTACATPAQRQEQAEAGQYWIFQKWTGKAAETDQEKSDARECAARMAEGFNDGDTALAVAGAYLFTPLAVVSAVQNRHRLPTYKACLREKGYTLDEYTLTPSGEWIKR